MFTVRSVEQKELASGCLDLRDAGVSHRFHSFPFERHISHFRNAGTMKTDNNKQPTSGGSCNRPTKTAQRGPRVNLKSSWQPFTTPNSFSHDTGSHWTLPYPLFLSSSFFYRIIGFLESKIRSKRIIQLIPLRRFTFTTSYDFEGVLLKYRKWNPLKPQSQSYFSFCGLFLYNSNKSCTSMEPTASCRELKDVFLAKQV